MSTIVVYWYKKFYKMSTVDIFNLRPPLSEECSPSVVSLEVAFKACLL
jgi:hypothetical protein